ncbi:membrane protein [Pseudoxanthomonas spadix BD-a59]|uniref:Membrane protein n=1 Tax=Pseudoxanthomonas spadix (strain BD-a59) TaxID=1045855 RepID=G7UTR9_PSEUP|nr:oligosaccharide flippase family protein [Pseudoxanthomonas spadix]AER56172.1 membrane protein [Pseudoxanthomonas spadix BD-a59]
MSAPEGLLERLNLRKNVSYAAGEFILTTLLLFVGYRLVIKQGGIEAIGVWSTLYAWTNLIRLGDAGVAVAATRFLAMWDVGKEQQRVRTYAETALLTNIVQFGALALIAYAGISPFVDRIVGADHAAEARHVLPWLLLGFFLLNVAGTLMGMLQGLHLGYRRSQLSVFGTMTQLAAVLVLVPSHGLIGLAWAQVAQYAIVMLLAFAAVSRKLGRVLRPYSFDLPAFRDMLGYSLKAQVVNIANGLIEPVSKMLVGHFGGMAAQGLYELAYKTVLLPRNLIASTVTAAMPSITALFRADRQRLRQLYARAFRLSAQLMAAASLAVVALAPLPSLFWLNRIDATYWLYVALLALGFLGNVVGIPAYLLGMASGHMRNNIIITLLAFAILLAVGWPAGIAFGGSGAVAIAACTVGLCGIAIWLTNRHLLHSEMA